MVDVEDFVEFTKVTRSIAASRHEVWRVLIAEAGTVFMGSEVGTDWVVGHPITFAGEWQGRVYQDKGEITSCDEPRELAFTQWSSASGKEDVPENYDLVTIDLADGGEGVLVTMHLAKPTGVEAPTGEQAASLDQNLVVMLDTLKDRVEGRSP